MKSPPSRVDTTSVSNAQAMLPDDTLSGIAERVSRAAPDGVSVSFRERHAFGRMSQVERYVLSNGLTVLLSVDNSAPVLAYHTWFRAGSRHERVGKTGIAHLFEHMMFKATRDQPEGSFDRLMEEAGVSTNASTWLDWTYYRANLPAGALPLVVRLESDRMENLLLNEEQLESERSVVLNERHLRVENDPEGKMYEAFYRKAFVAHPYGWPTIGWMEDIQGLSLDDCLEFYRLYYAPNNATIVLVGDQDRAGTLGLLLEHYGQMKAQPVPPETSPIEPPQTEERRLEMKLPLAAPKVVIGHKSPALTHADVPALQCANEVLFNSESTRLNRLLVTDLELASGVHGWVASHTYPALHEVYLSLKKETPPEKAEALVYEEFKRLADEGPTERELAKTRNKLESDLLRSMQTVAARARLLGNYETTTGDYKMFFRQLEAYRTVTADDVRRVVAEYLRPEGRTVAVALPQEEDERSDEDAEGGRP